MSATLRFRGMVLLGEKLLKDSAVPHAARGGRKRDRNFPHESPFVRNLLRGDFRTIAIREEVLAENRGILLKYFALYAGVT